MPLIYHILEACGSCHSPHCSIVSLFYVEIWTHNLWSLSLLLVLNQKTHQRLMHFLFFFIIFISYTINSQQQEPYLTVLRCTDFPCGFLSVYRNVNHRHVWSLYCICLACRAPCSLHATRRCRRSCRMSPASTVNELPCCLTEHKRSVRE